MNKERGKYRIGCKNMVYYNKEKIMIKNKEKIMIKLTEQEKNDLSSHYTSYEIDEQSEVQTDWVSRKLPSSGRCMRCVEKNGSVIIKQLSEL